MSREIVRIRRTVKINSGRNNRALLYETTAVWIHDSTDTKTDIIGYECVLWYKGLFTVSVSISGSGNAPNSA